MGKNLTPKEVYDFITKDFENVWDSVASNRTAKGRGNFMFAILAMSFLEFTCRLCASDPEKRALAQFSAQLHVIEPRYFERIEGLNAAERDFELPYVGESQTNDTLICAIFDLIRNGLAHQYQQILVQLNDDKHWAIRLTGPKPGLTFEKVLNMKGKGILHLRHEIVRDGDSQTTISPARLFLHFKKAFNQAELLAKPLTVDPLVRSPQKNYGKVYNFSSVDLASAFSKKEKARFRTDLPL